MAPKENLAPRARAKQRQILEAATQLFLRQGFAATSTDAITTAAGVSKQTVYSYFPSKEVLFSEVLRHLIDEKTPQQLEHHVNAAPLETREELQRALTTLAQRLIDTLMNPTYLSLIRITLAEFTRFPQLGQSFKEAVPHRVMSQVRRFLERAHSAGLAEVPDFDAATRLFLGPLIMHVILDGLLSPDNGPQPPSLTRIEELVGHFMRVIPPQQGDPS